MGPANKNGSGEDPTQLTVDEARENYYWFSTRASDVNRQLGFAAIGIVWVFRSQTGTGVTAINERLAIAAGLAISALALDLLQYLYATAAWGVFHGNMERHNQQRRHAPRLINWVTNVCFWGKAVAMVSAYAFILLHLATVIHVSR